MAVAREQIAGNETSIYAVVGVTANNKEPISLQNKVGEKGNQTSQSSGWSDKFKLVILYDSTHEDRLRQIVDRFSHNQMFMLQELMQESMGRVQTWMVRTVLKAGISLPPDIPELPELSNQWFSGFVKTLDTSSFRRRSVLAALNEDQQIRLKDILIGRGTNKVNASVVMSVISPLSSSSVGLLNISDNKNILPKSKSSY